MSARRVVLALVGLVVLAWLVPVFATDTIAAHSGAALMAPRSAAPTLAQKPTPRPTDNGDVIVYATKTGKKYHREGCSSLSKSKIPMKLRDAVAAGLGPCKNCKPPVLQK